MLEKNQTLTYYTLKEKERINILYFVRTSFIFWCKFHVFLLVYQILSMFNSFIFDLIKLLGYHF